MPQPNRSVNSLVLSLSFSFLILASLAIVMLNMGGPSTVCLLSSSVL